MDSPEKNSQNDATRIAGIILIVASLIAVLGITHHPIPADHDHADHDHGEHDHSIAQLVERVRSQQFANTLVHGTLIIVVGLFVLSTSYVSSLLGFNRICVRGGMISYGFGALCMAGAASVDGFVVLGWAERLIDTGIQALPVAEAIVAVLREINRVTALLGVVGMSLGVLLWSVAMHHQQEPWRIPGCIGVCVGLAGITGVLTGHLQATLFGMIWFVGMQVVWNIATATKVIRANPSIG